MTGELDPLPFRVACDLGGMTLAELDQRMSQAEWVKWRAWYAYKDAMSEWMSRR